MLGTIVSYLLGLIGAVVGGAVGVVVFQWLVGQGLYGLIIPGAMLGFGCGLLAQHRSHARGVVCGFAALLLGLYTQWRFSPLPADPGFKYLALHVYDLAPITQIMLGVGALFGYWLGKDASPLRSRTAPTRDDAPASPGEG